MKWLPFLKKTATPQQDKWLTSHLFLHYLSLQYFYIIFFLWGNSVKKHDNMTILEEKKWQLFTKNTTIRYLETKNVKM